MHEDAFDKIVLVEFVDKRKRIRVRNTRRQPVFNGDHPYLLHLLDVAPGIHLTRRIGVDKHNGKAWLTLPVALSSATLDGDFAMRPRAVCGVDPVDPTLENCSPKMRFLGMYAMTFRALRELVGEDRTLIDITHANCFN